MTCVALKSSRQRPWRCPLDAPLPDTPVVHAPTHRPPRSAASCRSRTRPPAAARTSRPGSPATAKEREDDSPGPQPPRAPRDEQARCRRENPRPRHHATCSRALGGARKRYAIAWAEAWCSIPLLFDNRCVLQPARSTRPATSRQPSGKRSSRRPRRGRTDLPRGGLTGLLGSGAGSAHPHEDGASLQPPCRWLLRRRRPRHRDAVPDT